MSDFSVDRLNIEISASATKASNALDKLITKVDKLTTSMSKLSTVSSKVNKSLSSIGTTTKAINVKPLNSLSSSITTISKQNTGLNKVVTTMNKLSTATKKVASATSGTSTGSSATRGGTGLMGMFGMVGKLSLIYYGLRRVGEGFAYAIGKANDLVETTNLFNVALGESVDQAREFVDEFTELTGVSQLELLEGVGYFYQISTSMGLASDKAAILSENFTKLAFDLASLYNIETEEAFTKLRAGLVGETEPLRRLGLVITENNLAETARRLGITKSIRTMTEMEKIQLRYITLMDQAKNAQGDFARTIEQPANMLRVLSGGIEQLAIAFGNLFLPILAKTLPYLIAFVNVLTDAINKLATFLGYNPDAFDSITSDISDLGDTAEETAESISSLIAPFDELNILNASSSSTSDASGDLLDLQLQAYDNLLSTLNPKWLAIAEEIEGAFNDAFGGIDTTKAIESLQNLQTELADLRREFIKPTWDWFVKNVVAPIAEWTIEVAVPGAFDTMAEALETIGNLGTVLIPILTLIESIFGMKVDSSVTDGFSLLENITGLSGDKDTMTENESVIDATFGTIFPAYNILQGDPLGIFEDFNTLFDFVFGDATWDERYATWTSRWDEIFSWSPGVEIPGPISLLQSYLSLGEFDSSAMQEQLSTVFSDIGENLPSNFSELFSDITSVTAPDLVSAMGTQLELIANGVIENVEAMFQAMVDTINSWLSSISGTTLGNALLGDFQLEDVDFPSIGDTTTGFGDDMDSFAANYQAMAEAMLKDPDAYGGDIVIQIDDKEIARASQSGTSSIDRQNGKTTYTSKPMIE